MKFLFIKSAKILLYSMLVFYILVAIFLIAMPEQRNFFTIMSCISAIVTVGLCSVVSISKFDKKRWIDCSIRTFALLLTCATYIEYLRTEYSFLSTSFHFISLSFDFCTALLSFIAIKGITWNEKQ
jgi:hypothetical protein